MVSDRIQKILTHKSKVHQDDLLRLGQAVQSLPLSRNVLLMKQTNQIMGINTILLNPATHREDFIFYFDRIVSMLLER